MKNRNNPFFRHASLAVSLFLLSGFATRAATFTYTGTSGTVNWSSGTNWTGGAPASNLDTILSYTSTLAASAAVVSNNDIASPPFKLNQLSFTNAGPASGTAPTLTLQGSQLEFVASSGSAIPTLIFNTTGTIKPTIEIKNNLLLTNNLGITATTDGKLSGIISGGGSITTSGAGTLNFANANLYTGGTSVGSGTRINLTNATGLGANDVSVSSGGQVFVNGALNVGNNFSIAGNGWTESGGPFGALRLANGSEISGTVALSGNSRITGSGTSTLSGAISGAFALEFGFGTATGVVVLSNASNSYSGGTTVTSGTLAVTTGVLGSNVNTNNVSVSAGANLILGSATNLGNNQTLTVNSTSTALGGIGVSGTLTLPAFTNSTSTFGGVYGINYTGSNGITSMAALESALNGNAGGGSGRWFLGSQRGGTFDGTTLAPASDGIYRLGGGGGTLTMSGANALTGANSVVIGSTSTNGGGTVVLGAAQNYTGATTVNAGTLRLGNAGALGDGTLNTSSVTVSGTSIFDLAGISPTANVPLNLNSTANGNDVGSLHNSAGTTTAVFGGPVNIQAATLTVGGGASSGGNITFTGAVTGNGKNLTKNGLGTLTLSNSGTVALGTLAGNRGTIQINSGTTLNVTGISFGTGNAVGSGLILNGGNVTSSSATAATFASSTSSSASGTLTINGGSTLTVFGLAKGGTAVATFNTIFNGGTLKATNNNSSYFTGANSAKVQVGGLTIDDSGFAITVGQSLTEDATSTGGGLNKSGIGTTTLSGTNTYTGGTTVNAGILLMSGATSLPTTGTLQVNAGGTFSLADGTVLTTTATNKFGLANGAVLAFDWNAGALDKITSTTAATTTGNVGIIINNTSPTGSGGTLISSSAGGLTTANGTKYFLANNTNFTASLNVSDTAVSIGTQTAATALTNAYWKGGQVSGALGAMALSSGTTSNWASAAAGTSANGVVPGGSAVNVIFGSTGAAQQPNVTTGANMNLGSITFNDSTAVTIGGSNAITLNSTTTTAATTTSALASVTAGSAISVTSFANANNTINANLALGAAQTWNIASGKTLNIGGVVSGNFALSVGGGGTVKISGTGSINPSNGQTLNIGSNSTAGTLQYDSSATSKFGAINVGTGTIQPGTLNQTAGTINATSLTLNNGYSGTGPGTLNLSGGTMTISGATTISNQVSGDNIFSTFTISGANTIFNANGELRLTGNGSSGGAGRNAAGKFVQNDGTVNVAGTNGLMLVQGYTAANTAIRRGQYDLNGGTLTVNTITSTSNAAADAVATFNFNGGTLKPTASSTTFWANNAQTTANVQNGGAKIDTDGKNITIGQSLLHFAGATTDSLTKSGAGTLTLTGTNTYTGETEITAGTLALGLSGSIANSSQIIVGANTTFDISAVSFTLGASNAQILSGTGAITGDMTVGANGTLAIGNSPGTMTFGGDLGLNADSISNFEINGFTLGNYDLALAATAGTQTVSFNGGTLNLLFQSGFSTIGTVKIFDFDAYNGSGFTSYVTTGLADGFTASFNVTNGSVTVIPEPRAALLGGLGLLAILRRRRA